MLLAASYPEIDIIGTIESVAEAVAWFGANPTPELVFMDIHLADGNSFRIFDSIRIECPIIFTTAYDQYALDAFRVNSIDYLLKPIKQSDLERAVGKLMALTSAASREYVGRTQEMVEKANNKSNSTLLVQVKDKIIPISTEDIAFFYTSNERVSVTTMDGRCYPVDGTLEGHYGALSTEQFFRANRQFIIARRAIRDMSVWFGSRLAVNLSVDTPERIIVSKARTSEFKAWLQ
jgi:DNA-binding LytR/AlgR family response regulator